MNRRWPLPVLVFLTGATAAVFLVMVLVTMPRLEHIAGMPFFDGRLEGYDKAEAKVLVARLGADGAGFYQTVQLPIDSAFVALFFVTLSGWMLFLARGSLLLKFVAAIGIAIALVGGLADLMENSAVSEMLSMSPEKIDDELGMTGSNSTDMKFVGDVAALVLVVVQAAVVLRPKHSTR